MGVAIRGVAVVLLSVAGACGGQEPARAPAPEAATRTALLEAPSAEFVSVDTRHAALARTTIPGYAGIERIGHQSYRVSLTDLASLDAAAAHFREQLGEPNARFEARLVKYDFVELHDWKSALFDGTPLPAWYELDIDERDNRLEISMADSSGVAEIHALARARGIPDDALFVRIGAPMRPDTQPNPLTRPER